MLIFLADKAALDPLSLTEILEVSAGCDGFDPRALPLSSKRTKRNNDNMGSSLFLTLKASPTPIASSRSYFLKFKSRSARNDLLLGLRGLLADMQINEGINISSISAPPVVGHVASSSPMRTKPSQDNQVHSFPLRMKSQQNNNPIPLNDSKNMLVSLSEVHKTFDLERQAYDKLLLVMLQGSSDLKKSEDDLVAMQGRLDAVITDSKEKDRIQANDSKLIMQLSKKLETLLMDNEDLRDQNETLNNRIIMMEGEKVNKVGLGSHSFFGP